MRTNVSPRELALDLLERSRCRVKMAAVLTDTDGFIFAWGWNHAGARGLGEHAEAHALSRANKKRVKGAKVTVAGKRKDAYVKSLPCLEKCFPMLVRAGVHEIEYHDKEGKWESLEIHT